MASDDPTLTFPHLYGIVSPHRTLLHHHMTEGSVVDKPAFLVVRTGGQSLGMEPLINHERAQLAKVGAELRVVACKTPDDVLAAARDADVVIHPSYVPFPRQVIAQLTRCKGIVVTKVGTDNIDVPACTEHGIIVANLPDGWTNEVADQAMGFVIALNRQIVVMDQGTKEGNWPFKRILDKRPLALRRLTMGIYGLGRIGRAMTVRAQAFGMTVIANDPLIEQSVFDQYHVESVGFEDLLKRSDVLSIHAPLTDHTFHVINEQALRMMKPTALVINTARGPLIDEKALIRALQEGWIAGAGLDVFEQEPTDPANPLLTLENVVVTPHTCGMSDAAAESQFRPVFDAVRILQGLPPRPEAFVNRELWLGAKTSDRRPSNAQHL
jgi:D-3-phosphoglycerate dehydrogenase